MEPKNDLKEIHDGIDYLTIRSKEYGGLQLREQPNGSLTLEGVCGRF
jgi:hypothetical protein